MMRGTVRNIPEGKNFGFLMDATNRDYFFHREDFDGFWRDLVHDYNTGKTIQVEFEPVENSPKGARASKVRRIDFLN